MTKRLRIAGGKKAAALRDEVPGKGDLGPREALALLKSLNAPVGPVETMIEESIAGPYS